MVHRPFRWYRHLTLNAYWFGVSLMWNALHPIVLPVLVLAFAPESAKNTSYGLLTFAGLVVAALVQPISGSLSDGTQHHLGRRRPWILAGTAASLLCLTGLAVARSFWAIAGAYVLLQCCSNIAHGPAQGLMRDAVPSGHRGPAAGAKQLFDMLAVIIAATFAGRLMDDGVRDAASMMALIAGVLVVFTAVTTLTVHEPTATAHAGPIRSLREHLAALAQIDYGQHRDYLRLLAARFCVLLGTYAVQSFGLFYFRDVLQVASASRATSGLMAAVAVSIMVTALPAGSLSERWGRKRPLVIACALTGVGLALLLAVRDLVALWGVGCLVGAGMGIFSAVSFAWATDMVPADEAGKYLGLSNLSTAGAAAGARLLGPVMDLMNARWSHAGYGFLIVFAAAAAFVGLVIAMGIPDTPAPGLRRTARARRRAGAVPAD
ncbi:MAG TPA: SLC45 family MFS transporter [Chloroflexi bacterium]|jgi:MFS family permease|nr:SLC45 family MFS transporter [Chloroflexota bacterium]